MYLPIAFELARERTRELERLAQAREAAEVAMTANPRGPRWPNRARHALARPVRALSGASHALSEAACTAAARIEGTAP